MISPILYFGALVGLGAVSIVVERNRGHSWRRTIEQTFLTITPSLIYLPWVFPGTHNAVKIGAPIMIIGVLLVAVLKRKRR